MRNKYTLPVMAAAAVMVSPIVAQANTNVNFSFTGKKGKVVSGSLIFASSAGTKLFPTDLKLTANPFGGAVDLGAPTYKSMAGFTLSHGSIIGGSALMNFKASTGKSDNLRFNSGSPKPIADNYFSQSAVSHTSNTGGFKGVTFTTVNASTPAPEPASIALLGAGIAGLATFRRRRRRRARA